MAFEMTTTAKKDLKVSEDVAKKLAEAYNEGDSGQESKVPRIKINYDDASLVCKPGEWVVGQRKNQDGEIVEEGAKVDGFIAIVARNAWSLYDSKDKNNCCNSPLFFSFRDEIRGSTHKNICGKKTCPFAATKDCKAQKVVFGVALTKNGPVDCVGYFAGVSYMPVAEYIEKAQSLLVGDIIKRVPVFSYIAELGSKADKKGTVKFFHPILTHKWLVTEAEDIDELTKKRDLILHGLLDKDEEPQANPTIVEEDDDTDFTH